MKHYEVVCAVIYNDNNEIFIARRGKGRALEGFFEFPGGKEEIGETKEEAITREIKEELNADIKPIKYLGSSYYEYTNLDGYDPFSITLYAYKCKLISNTLTLSEHTEYKFVSLEELKNIKLAMADIKLLEYLD